MKCKGKRDKSNFPYNLIYLSWCWFLSFFMIVYITWNSITLIFTKDELLLFFSFLNPSSCSFEQRKLRYLMRTRTLRASLISSITTSKLYFALSGMEDVCSQQWYQTSYLYFQHHFIAYVLSNFKQDSFGCMSHVRHLRLGTLKEGHKHFFTLNNTSIVLAFLYVFTCIYNYVYPKYK